LASPDVVFAQATGDSIPITSARQLDGRLLRSSDGKSAGLVEALLLDIPRGEVLYAIVGSGSDLDLAGKHVAVPFTALDPKAVASTRAITVNRPLATLATSRALDWPSIAELGAPQWVARIYQIYGVPVPFGYPVAPVPAPPEAPFQNTSTPPDRLTVVGNTARALSPNVHGRDVLDRDDKPFGAIEQIVIDPAAARIAYFLLSVPSGPLGIRETWRAVPPEAVTWVPAKDAFVLVNPKLTPPAMKSLHQAKLPARVSRADIAALYKHFDLAPYWERTAGDHRAPG
jgi:sporulation protein YlmC with PRC-barrel domain